VSRRLFLVVLALVAAVSCLCGCPSKKVPEFDSTRPMPSATASASAAGSTSSNAPPSEAPSAAAPDAASDARPTSAVPVGTPHFAWHGPLSVQVDEKTDQQGHRIRFSYALDVCPGTKGETLVTHKNLHVTELEGAATDPKKPTKEVHQVEAAASTLPTMVIDAYGNFERGTGYPEMLKHLAENFPGEDFSQLRQLIDNGQAAGILDTALAQLWQSWVSVWLHYDPAHGVSQEVILDKNIGSDASRPQLFFDGFSPEHHVKLHARVAPSRAELDQMAGAAGASGESIKKAELVWSVETEWPDIRPLTAKSQRRATVHAQGKDTETSESHEYTFTWPPAGAKAPSCP
jgi:hypothetical protein